MAINDVLAAATSPSAAKASDTSGYGSLKPEDFVKLLITQLSSQDPLNPMESQDMLDQLNSINSISSTQTLVDTLTSLTSTQGLGSASNLIGKTVTGNVGNESINGVVEKAVVEDGEVFVVIGENKLSLDNITEIV